MGYPFWNAPFSVNQSNLGKYDAYIWNQRILRNRYNKISFVEWSHIQNI